ncbi:unnamed protein product [Hyaloperonospora brassicae]|uniref:Peptidase S33 tripeptidyl aminopeptidase-like C-terminal domain-containing protein n=1 Tax=Hyaloperonospora brassicae TaxID=162125 RepID=A0AAV0U163_HYABA|nr:unnamed protein product [Hyaloperonospora brassicae]
MRVHRVATLSAVCLSFLGAVATAKKSNLNGWYKCSDVTFSDEGNSTGMIAECAVYKAPLCYPGICVAPASVDPTVDIFVKRLPAASEDPATAHNVWLLQGGPGISSSSLESTMSYLNYQLEGKFNIYTMDHRGTGRSTRLDCVSAQATTTGSPFGSEIELSEVTACAQDLKYKYGDLASFSITSSATDIATFIAKYTNGEDTIVYGLSYGTTLAERLMHLKTPTVIGYVLDGVATTSAAAEDKFQYVSKMEVNSGEMGDAFLDVCIDDEGCSRHFRPRSLPASLRHLIEKFDKEPHSACAQLVKKEGLNPRDSPSLSLRSVLGWMLPDPALRAFIPVVVYRLSHCEKGDLTVLTRFFTSFKLYIERENQDVAYRSLLLYHLIVFSEMWETPAPSFGVLKKRLADSTMYPGEYEKMHETGLVEANQYYCAYSKEKSPACDKLHLGNNGSSAIIYKRDRYWNKTSVIPSHASVLILSSKMDAQTPHKYAKALFKGMVGSNKELVTFKYATHGTVMSTELAGGGEFTETCGMKLLGSYVKNGGNLDRLDKSCLKEMPALNLTIPMGQRTYFLGLTEDAYDGGTTRARTSLSA